VNKNAFIAITVALLVPLVAYFIGKKYSYDAVTMPRHYIYDSTILKTVNGKQVEDTLWHQVPDFSLTNQLGKTVSWKDLEGKIVVADFFFTRCPTICVQLTQNMKRLQNGLTNAQRAGDRSQRFVQFLSFSVDPERDSVAALKKWSDRFGINPESWWLLTGPKKEIYDLSIEHMKVMAMDGVAVDSAFLHTDFMVLIDKKRNIRGYYHGLDTVSVAQLARDIVLLSLEKDTQRKKFFEGKLELIAIVFLFTTISLGLLLYFFKKEKKHVVYGN
jgi:protein SCO1/2